MPSRLPVQGVCRLRASGIARKHSVECPIVDHSSVREPVCGARCTGLVGMLRQVSAGTPVALRFARVRRTNAYSQYGN